MNNYYIKSQIENGVIKIEHKKIADLYYSEIDQIIFVCKEGDIVISKYMYDYETEDFYKTAIFSAEEHLTQYISNFERKLVFLFSEEWINSDLYPFLNSPDFLEILKQVAELRKLHNVTPSKEDVFLPFQNSIKDTIISDYITKDEVNPLKHIEIWSKFVSLANNIKRKHINYYDTTTVES